MLVCCLAVGWIAIGSVSGAFAQDTKGQLGVVADELLPLVEKAKNEGLSVIILSPGMEKPQANGGDGAGMQERSLLVRKEILRIAANSVNAWQETKKALLAASPDGTWWWLLYAVGTAALGMAISSAIASWTRPKIQNHFKGFVKENPANRAEKISFLMFRALLILANVTLMFLIAMLVAVILDSGHEPSRQTIFIIISSYASYWIFRAVILFNLVAHDLPEHRMINLSDDDAKMVQFDWRNSMVIVILAFAACAWMEALGVSLDIHKFFLIIAMLTAVIIFGYLTIKHRKAFAEIGRASCRERV